MHYYSGCSILFFCLDYKKASRVAIALDMHLQVNISSLCNTLFLMRYMNHIL